MWCIAYTLRHLNEVKNGIPPGSNPFVHNGQYTGGNPHQNRVVRNSRNPPREPSLLSWWRRSARSAREPTTLV